MTAEQGRIYWANWNASKLSCANLDGSEARDLCSTLARPWGLTLDRREEELWYTMPGQQALHWTRLDGPESGEEQVGAEAGPYGMALNREANPPCVYWSGAFTFWGAEKSAEGVFCSELGVGIVYGIQNAAHGLLALEPPEAVYWASGEKIFGRADRYSFVQELVSTSGCPGGVAVDPTRTLYWTNHDRNSMERRTLPDGETEVLAVPGATVSSPAGIAVDAKGERVYWANESGGKEGTGAISWAHLGGSEGGDLEIAGATLAQPHGIAVLMAPSVETLPTICGGSLVGATPLQCDPGSCAPDETAGFVFRDANSATYQWLFEGNPIDGATESSYSPQQAGCYSCAVTHANAAGATVAEAPPHYVQKQN